MPASPEAAGAARRWLRDALAATGHEDWVDDGVLALSEVVTNVLLHAHTETEISIEVGRDAARVDVRDTEPTLPSPRGYHDDALTGRGLHLVEAVTSCFGVWPLGDAGKIVWFCLGSGMPVAAPPEVWASAESAPAGTARRIALLGMPVRLWFAAREHHDASLRELSYYLAERPDPTIDISRMDRARAVIARALRAESERQGTRGEPASGAEDVVDLVLEVEAGDGSAFAATMEILDRADALAAEGLLLAAPSPEAVAAVRNWVCGQVVSQLAGSPPVAWSGPTDLPA